MSINLTSAAVILWSGMLVIAGAVLVLSSQVRHLVELLESRAPTSATPVQNPNPNPNPKRQRPVASARARNAGPRAVASASSTRLNLRRAMTRDAAA